jgi:hypothetical protein
MFRYPRGDVTNHVWLVAAAFYGLRAATFAASAANFSRQNNEKPA